MNIIQKRFTLFFAILIFISCIYVPLEYVRVGDGVNTTSEFVGFNLLFKSGELDCQISLRTIFVEWTGILVLYLAVWNYFKE